MTLTVTDDDRRRFLQEDFYNALRYLFEGAVAWRAWKQSVVGELLRHQGVLAMYTTFVEARALYEFFYRHTDLQNDDASADHFVLNWEAPESPIYQNYIKGRAPANKRLFHLVYLRSDYSGETTADALNEQVLNVALDLRDVAMEFIKHIEREDFQELAQTAFDNAFREAQKAVEHYEIANPL